MLIGLIEGGIGFVPMELGMVADGPDFFVPIALGTGANSVFFSPTLSSDSSKVTAFLFFVFLVVVADSSTLTTAPSIEGDGSAGGVIIASWLGVSCTLTMAPFLLAVCVSRDGGARIERGGVVEGGGCVFCGTSLSPSGTVTMAPFLLSCRDCIDSCKAAGIGIWV